MSLVEGLLNQTITTISSITSDGYDESKTTVYSSVPCRWQETEGRIFDKDMSAKDYKVEVWILPSYLISYDYIITKDSEDYKVVRILKRVGLDGELDHIKLYLV